MLLQGPYKQYMGRSRNTGQLSLVLYEDPPDGVPKIHVRSSKYMAWIAEMMLPTYLHVNKVFYVLTLVNWNLNFDHNYFRVDKHSILISGGFLTWQSLVSATSQTNQEIPAKVVVESAEEVRVFQGDQAVISVNRKKEMQVSVQPTGRENKKEKNQTMFIRRILIQET